MFLIIMLDMYRSDVVSDDEVVLIEYIALKSEWTHFTKDPEY